MKVFNYDISITKIKPRTAIHPDIKKKTVFAFTIDGVDYYEFENLIDMPIERYKQFQDLATQCDWRMSIDEIKNLVKAQKEAVNKGKLTDIMEVIQGFEHCLSIYMETDLFMMLFSCVFFTKDENIYEWDYDIGIEKMEVFKKHGIPDFFLREPVKKYLPVTDISKQDLEVFSRQTNVKKDYLQSILQRVSQSTETKG